MCRVSVLGIVVMVLGRYLLSGSLGAGPDRRIVTSLYIPKGPKHLTIGYLGLPYQES